MAQPVNPSIYHITHVDNLPGILAEGGLWSDADMLAQRRAVNPIGMPTIKQRRLRLPVKCHVDLMVGGCVPFYLCPRSVMLFLLHKGNHPEVTYTGGQGPLVHLEADLREVAAWADQNMTRWAFTTGNAAASYHEHYADLGRLDKVDWAAVQATQWSGVQERKAAEFLVEQFFPFALVRRIGVISPAMRQRVLDALAAVTRHPPVAVLPAWYY